MKMTKREKTLIWILVNVFVLLVGVKFILIPISEGYSVAKEELEIYQSKESEAQALLMQKSTIEQALEASRVTFKEVSKSFFDLREAEYFQLWISELRGQSTLEISSLQIEEAEVSSLDSGDNLIFENRLSMTLRGTKQATLNFINRLLHSGRHVVLNSLDLGVEVSNLIITVYSVEKESDEALDYPFKKPLGQKSIVD